MFTPFGVFCVLGCGVYIFLFYLLEKTTGIPFITNDTFFFVVFFSWSIVSLILGHLIEKYWDEDFFKSY